MSRSESESASSMYSRGDDEDSGKIGRNESALEGIVEVAGEGIGWETSQEECLGLLMNGLLSGVEKEKGEEEEEEELVGEKGNKGSRSS